MSVTWTTEQQRVIDSRGQNLLVSAAAGSGKTAVLVQHVIDRILDPVDPVNVSELLVVTFTRAAAAEMKERLRRRLEEEAAGNPDHPSLRRQIGLVDQARICTIDSFCSWLVKNYFHMLDIDPDFRIADEAEAKLLQQDVLSSLLEEKYEEADPRFLRMMDVFTRSNEDGKIRELVLTICRRADSMAFPEEWLAGLLAQPESEDTLENFAWGPEMRGELQEQCRQWGSLMARAEECCSQYPGLIKMETMFRKEKENLQVLTEADTLDSLMERLAAYTNTRMPVISAKDKANCSQEELELLATLRTLKDLEKKGMSDDIRKYYGTTGTAALADLIRATSSDRRAALELAAEYRIRYQRAKKEKNLAEFGDVAHWALALLLRMEDGREVRTELADTLGRQFREIIVDEYQDSSMIQEKLLTALSGEDRGDPDMFMVGDVKQSIYRFRLARPDLFMGKYASYSYGAHEGAGCKIDLAKNFRSRRMILDSINQVFDGIMSEENGGIQYDDHAKLYYGSGQYEGEDPPAELVMIRNLSEDMVREEAEARVIAGKIQEMMDPAHPLMVSEKDGSRRPVRYSDMVILLRTARGWAEAVQQTLALEGIPAFTESSKGYFEAPEILTLMSFLRILDNPLQDIPLAAVMRSPIGGFSDEEMAEMAAEATGTETRPFYHRCEEAAEHGICREKWETFTAMVELWRKRAVYLSIDQLLERFLEESGYGLLLTASVDGPVCMANVEMLMEQARTFETTIYHGIFNFLRYMDQVKTYELDYGEAHVRSETEDLVRITTIHKSKGLEYPVVFVAAMGKEFNLTDEKEPVQLDDRYGLICDYRDLKERRKVRLPHRRIILNRMKREACQEEMRILYVALTRAREKLICIGTPGSKRNPEKKTEVARMWRDLCRMGLASGGKIPAVLENSCRTYLDWMAMTVIDAPGNLWKVNELEGDDILEGETLRILEQDTLLRQWREFGFTREKDDEVSAAWERACAWTYPVTDFGNRKSVYSVSELKHEAAEEFLAAREGITASHTDRKAYTSGENVGAARGTAYHLVLEKLYAGRCSTREGIESELDRLVREEVLSGEARNLVDPHKLLRYYCSELGQRMIRAEEKGSLYREQPFVMGVDPGDMSSPMKDTENFVLIQGIIDAFLVEEGNIILWDYKTDRIPAGTDPETYLLGMYQRQLQLYAHALERSRGQRVTEIWIYSFAADRLIAVPASV